MFEVQNPDRLDFFGLTFIYRVKMMTDHLKNDNIYNSHMRALLRSVLCSVVGVWDMNAIIPLVWNQMNCVVCLCIYEWHLAWHFDLNDERGKCDCSFVGNADGNRFLDPGPGSGVDCD